MTAEIYDTLNFYTYRRVIAWGGSKGDTRLYLEEKHSDIQLTQCCTSRYVAQVFQESLSAVQIQAARDAGVVSDRVEQYLV